MHINPAVYWMLVLAAFLTAFYMGRQIMMVFFGKEHYHEIGAHPHEMPKFMLWAMSPLLVLAIIGGFAFEGSYVHMVSNLLPMKSIHVEGSTFWVLLAAALGISLTGILVAVVKYRAGGFKESWEKTFVYNLLFNQYYIPKLYDEAICKPYAKLATFAWKTFDLKVVDFTVDLVAKLVYAAGEKSRGMHTGNLSSMLRLMVTGLIILLAIAVAMLQMTQGA